MENISEFADDSMMDEIVTVYADKGYDAKYIRNYLKCNGMNCCIPYKKIPDSLYQKTRTTFTIKQDLLLSDSLHGSNVVYTELESDMKRIVIIIWDLYIWHQL